MKRLNGKAAVVLGAAGHANMGQALARRFRDEGAQVVVAGRDQNTLGAFAEEIGAHAIACDITSKADVAALAQGARAIMGKVDVAVNATGLNLTKPFLDMTPDDIDGITAVQFKGAIFFFQAMVTVMGRAYGGEGGSLIQISSATASIMLEDHAAYMGTKAGTDHVLRCVANEFGQDGIRANSISPGLTDTPMTAGAMMLPGLRDAFVPGYPLGRIGTLDDIASAAVWIASDECFMTGQNFQVNGGLTLRRNPTSAEVHSAVATAMAAASAA